MILYENFFIIEFILLLPLLHILFLTFSFKDLSIWYLIHSLGNIYITTSCLEPIKTIIQDPLHHMYNITPFYNSTFLIIILHLYHMIFFSCTKADIFHHLCFVGIGSTTIFIFNSGYYSALAHFFICGFPGIIDYFYLFLYNEGYIEKKTRLKEAVFINLWIRSPGLIMTSTFSVINYIYSKKQLFNLIEMIFQISTMFFNGQIYLRDVIYTSGKLKIYD